MNEFELIDRYFNRPAKRAVVGIGDDCAVIGVSPGHELAMSTDMLVEGRHFFAGTDPERLGHKALAVNLSDCAANGARPRHALLSMALPSVDEAWLAAFSRGFFALADRFDVELIGGDTTRGPLNLCVTIVGEVPAGQSLLRSNARVGDSVWVSGRLGSAAIGLHLLNRNRGQTPISRNRSLPRGDSRTPIDCDRIALSHEAQKAAIDALEQPEPRVALGIALRGIATSAIDVSDGLAGDLRHILERSRVGAQIEVARIPCESWLRAMGDCEASRSTAYRALLAGGDDYELCFTAPASRDADVLAASRAAGVDVTPVGSIVAGDALTIIDRDGSTVSMDRIHAFDHFR